MSDKMSDETVRDNTRFKTSFEQNPFRTSVVAVLDKENIKAPPKTLYHYTSTQGLMGILDSRCLWLTDAAYLNDPTEVVYGVDELSKACSLFVSGKGEQETKFINEVVKTTENLKRRFRVAVFCASESDDLLNQWRDYGKDDVAYCIGFDWRKMANYSSNKLDCNFQVGVTRMIYDSDRQLDLCRKIIQSISDTRKNQGFDRKGYSDKIILELAAVEILSVMRMFKHPAYTAEKEIRLVTYVDSILRSAKREHRFTSLGLTPYFKWHWKDSSRRLPITSVRVGPCRHPMEAKQAVKDLLDDHGYLDVTVSGSTAPTR